MGAQLFPMPPSHHNQRCCARTAANGETLRRIKCPSVMRLARPFVCSPARKRTGRPDVIQLARRLVSRTALALRPAHRPIRAANLRHGRPPGSAGPNFRPARLGSRLISARGEWAHPGPSGRRRASCESRAGPIGGAKVSRARQLLPFAPKSGESNWSDWQLLVEANFRAGHSQPAPFLSAHNADDVCDEPMLRHARSSVSATRA